MNTLTLIPPVGGLPEGSPKGLNDLLWNPPPTAAEQAQQLLSSGWHQHAPLLTVLGIGLALLLALTIYLLRDWRGRLLRWQLKRLARLASRRPETLPEPMGAALTWALARYFKQRPALDRPALPAEWQTAVRTLDALRFGGRAASPAAWLDVLETLHQLSRHPAQAAAATPKAES